MPGMFPEKWARLSGLISHILGCVQSQCEEGGGWGVGGQGGGVKSVGVRDGVSEEERDKMEWLNETGMTMEA